MGKSQITMAVVCSEHHLSVLDYLLSKDYKYAETEVVVGTSADGTERMPLLNFCAKKGEELILNLLFRRHFKTPQSIQNSLDSEGNTPLHVVWKSEIASQLLKRASFDVLKVPNKKGQLPIDCILERYNKNFLHSPRQVPSEHEKQQMKETINFFRIVENSVPALNNNTAPPMAQGRKCNLSHVSLGADVLQQPVPPLNLSPSMLPNYQAREAALPSLKIHETSWLDSQEILDAAIMVERRQMLSRNALLRRQQQQQMIENSIRKGMLTAIARNPMVAVRDISGPSSPPIMRFPLNSATVEPNANEEALPSSSSSKYMVAAIDAAFACDKMEEPEHQQRRLFLAASVAEGVNGLPSRVETTSSSGVSPTSSFFLVHAVEEQRHRWDRYRHQWRSTFARHFGRVLPCLQQPGSLSRKVSLWSTAITSRTSPPTRAVQLEWCKLLRERYA